MIFPTISEYIEAIRYAEDNFATLTSLRPVLDGDGNPVMSSGNFAVVFKMRDEKSGKCHALKCFIKDQDGRSESYRLISDELEDVSNDCFVRIQYKENELYVNTSSSPTTDFPVLLMDWVDGITLDRYVSQHIHDRYALRLICYQFCRMASWLMSQPFAHGDLKPDNILVRSDNSLVLVDYDGMFVPAMSGQQARETGSPDYRHPLRTIDDFNEHIDDFSLAAIAMQLFAVSLDPGLLAAHHGDTLLLTAADHHDPAASAAHGRLKPLLTDPVFERLYALYHFAHATQHLDAISFRAFNIPKPTFVPQKEELSTKVTKEDLENGVKDEYGAIYSADGSRLLKGPSELEEYHISEGARVICDEAFLPCKNLTSIELPSSVTHIGDRAFSGCWSLTAIKLPSSVTHIGDYAFYGCSGLTSIVLPSSVTHIGDDAFSCCRSLTSIELPSSVTHIGSNPFSECDRLHIENRSPLFETDSDALYTKGKKQLIALYNHNIVHFRIPSSVTHIGDRAFSGCRSLTSIELPSSVTHIGDRAFDECIRLTSIELPSSVTHIGNRAFIGCESLTSIELPSSVTHIGEGAFSECRSLTAIKLPSSVTHIGDGAFSRCRSLTLIKLPSSVTHIGEGAFRGCEYLTSIELPSSVTHIGYGAFLGCEYLTSIELPSSVTHIGNSAFRGCSSLTSIELPSSVTHIGDEAFYGCSSLTSIELPSSITYIGKNPFGGCVRLHIESESPLFETDSDALYTKGKKQLIALYNHDIVHFRIPSSVTHIGNWAFNECSGLTSIVLPSSVTHIGDEAFRGCKGLTSIVLPSSVTHIGDSAFRWCSSLTSIELPSSVTHIGDDVFGGGWLNGPAPISSIYVPKGTKDKFMKLLPSGFHDKIIER